MKKPPPLMEVVTRPRPVRYLVVTREGETHECELARLREFIEEVDPATGHSEVVLDQYDTVARLLVWLGVVVHLGGRRYMSSCRVNLTKFNQLRRRLAVLEEAQRRSPPRRPRTRK